MEKVVDHSVEIITDLVYAEINGRQLLADIYLPRLKKEPLPVIIWLHGGGWRFGDRKLGPDFTRYFASKGYAMVSIDYRLSDEDTFPAQIHDVKTAIRWVKTIAAEYGLDGNKIGLWGSSAGGHLAALAATTEPNQFIGENPLYSEMTSEVQAVAIGYGPMNFLQIDEQRELYGISEEDPESVQIPKDKKTSDPDSFESLFLGAPILTCPERVKEANPLTYVKSGLPPFLIMHGLSDIAVPAHQSKLLYQELADKKNNVSLYLINGLGHGFLNRTDLDEGGPRVVRSYVSKNGEEKINEGMDLLVFGTIEDFFRRELS
ncbi:acetyl esterase/lipase [Neobacillus bataviensis]|uniref:Acetyl esterase/lipase n=1 Tax=Neobacillus bataviensis TaxID=220685 RepID=A0A561E0K6_9BACI|nr:alpha/beta hydrolase [Neobacillus bataviensis]TWE09176.1 acetyl esterase/lipase [Neobacillus bataviensis]